jgi:hypothetical protein
MALTPELSTVDLKAPAARTAADGGSVRIAAMAPRSVTVSRRAGVALTLIVACPYPDLSAVGLRDLGRSRLAL